MKLSRSCIWIQTQNTFDGISGISVISKISGVLALTFWLSTSSGSSMTAMGMDFNVFYEIQIYYPKLVKLETNLPFQLVDLNLFQLLPL